MPEKSKVQKKKFKSLTVTMTASFLGLSVFILVFSMSLELFFSFKTQQTYIASQQELIAKNASESVRAFMANKFATLSQADEINNLANSEGRRLLVMNKVLGRDLSLRQLFLIATSGDELLKVSRLSDLAADPLSDLKQVLLQEIFTGKNYISPIYVDPATGEPLVLIAVPTNDSFHQLQGAFVAEVNLKFIWDLVDSIQVGKNGHAYVADKQGKLIAFSDVSRVLAHEDISALAEVSQFMKGENHTGAEVSKGILGTSVVSSYASLGTPDWAVVVELPLMEAYETPVQLLLYSLLILALCAFVAVVSGIYLSRRITRGIVVLSAAAEQLSRGKLDTRIELSNDNTDDEIDQLALSFSVMAVKLRALYEGMDEKIKEKTTELSSQVEEVEKSRSAILNLLEDIDAEKRSAEEMVVVRTKELSDEKARLLASINSLSFGFVIVDNTSEILIKNPALNKILELVDEPKTLADIAKYFQGIDLAKLCQECIALNNVVEHSNVSYGKKFLRVFCAPVVEQVENQLKVIGNVVLVEDITEAKVMERSRDEFFAVASHELRTPLTAIRGNADMILEMYADKIADKDMKEMLQDINSSSVRLIDIVNDFLEVSRLEQGKFEMKSERFNPAEVVEKVVRDLKEMIAQKGLTLNYTPLQDGTPDIQGDRNRVEQILVNFVGNSAKFTKSGSITISLEQQGEKLRFRVADTGTGISEHNQALLFRKFQQAGEQMLARDVSQSTGLGLYICKLIVGNMGGEIGLEKSELGVGSVFFFTMPIAR